MDFETARANMIEQQIRPWNVLNIQTLEALAMIRREDFVPEGQRDLAFADVKITLTNGDVMLEPKVSARMMEALQLSLADRVLEIGTGSGYLTALLASVSGHVTSIEIDADMMATAERNLALNGISNYSLVCADGHAGWGERGQFDAILISGSLSEIPVQFMDSLTSNGRLVGIEGFAPAMQAVLITKQSDQANIVRKALFETSAPRLKNAEDQSEFIF